MSRKSASAYGQFASGGCYISEDPKKFAAGINFFAYAGSNSINANDPTGLYPAVQVTNPDGSTYIPMTTVKNDGQSAAYGLPKGAQTAIAVPSTDNAGNPVVPQAQVNYWANPWNQSNLAFALYWIPHGTNDYKSQSPMFDAYGNFAYGATGEASGYSSSTLTVMGDITHPNQGFVNNPINTQDIQSGYNAIANGGTLGTVEYTPSTSAAGGFLLYPNKPNTNQIQSVYNKP